MKWARVVAMAMAVSLGGCLETCGVRMSPTRREALRQMVLAPSVVSTFGLAQEQPALAVTDEAVQVLRRQSSEVYLIGTAHVSSLSAALVAETIDAVEPDLVAVELDRKRVGRVSASDAPSGPAPRDSPIRRLGALAVGAVLRSMYASLDKLGLNSGAEFAVALSRAADRGIPVLLADQDVDETLARLGDAVRATNPDRIAALEAGLLAAVGDGGEAELEAVFTSSGSQDAAAAAVRAATERLKTRETVRGLVAALRESTPELYAALVDERDAAMTNNLLAVLDSDRGGAAAGGAPRRVVFVVGMAHEDGIARRLRDAGFRPAVGSSRRRTPIAAR